MSEKHGCEFGVRLGGPCPICGRTAFDAIFGGLPGKQ